MSEEEVEKAAESVVAATEALTTELSAAERVAAFLEKARLGEYLDLMNRPLRMMWLNFLGGIARGVGLVIGGSIVGVLLLVLVLQALKLAFHRVGGLPMVGEQLKELIGWILQVVDQKQMGGE
jgi:hypothetical protein